MCGVYRDDAISHGQDEVAATSSRNINEKIKQKNVSRNI